ncbi:amidohydrolase family protein [Mesorhizobium sp. M0902]|uniref:amidohydrolase family protein n=1 Tax=unclassified Mesorhizobium TaxID=325217 RepID=UPI00333DCC4A
MVRIARALSTGAEVLLLDPGDPVGETRWLQEIANKRGFPHGIVGYADLSQPDVGDLLDRHMEYPNFRGMRQPMNYHPDPAKTYLARPEVSRTPEWRRGFRELAKRGLSFDPQLYYPQMSEFLELARDFPDVQIILNHTGMQVDAPSIEEAIAAFGVGRSMFATNFPVDKLFSSFDAILNAFKEITIAHPHEERLALFHDNAARFYRL